MQRRILLSGLFAAAVAVAGCTDDTPTLSGDDAFPPGTTPVTREVLVPASQFLRVLGTYSGYTKASDAAFIEVAENYNGLYAHALSRFNGFPRSVTYRAAGGTRTDTTFSYLASSLVARLDTVASTVSEPVTLSVYALAQPWDPGSATWENAVDTTGVRTPWTQPGGTRGALLAQATRAPGGADSLVFTLPAAAVRALSDTLSPGIVITSSQGTRVRLISLLLRAAVRPDSAAAADTSIVNSVSSGPRAGIYTPEQPTPPAGVIAVGGIRSARTLLELDLRQQVPACSTGNCGTVPLSQVELNSVGLVLRPVAVPGGFNPLGFMSLRLRRVSEPELGRFAPLGAVVSDEGAVRYRGGDSLAVVSATAVSFSENTNADLPNLFALVNEGAGNSPQTFGVAFFQADPMLRIIYTIPARRQLP